MSNKKETTGCLLAFWSMFITGPIWLALLYSILDALGDSISSMVWALYLIYVPAHVLGVIFVALFQQAMAEE